MDIAALIMGGPGGFGMAVEPDLQRRGLTLD